MQLELLNRRIEGMSNEEAKRLRLDDSLGGTTKVHITYMHTRAMSLGIGWAGQIFSRAA
jgi:hypothetical protein